MQDISKTLNGNRLSGTYIAHQLLSHLQRTTSNLDFQPGIAVIIVGDDPASHVYVRAKDQKATACGFKSVQYKLPQNYAKDDLLSLIQSLNQDQTIDGILVQLPLPNHLDTDQVVQKIDPTKDIDGFHYINAGMLATGARNQTLIPCTPLGCLYMIQYASQHLYGSPSLSGKEAIVIGRSNIVGKPMAQLLLSENATVQMTHSATQNLAAKVAVADIIIAAVGKPNFITGDWIKPGAIAIDVGINRIFLENGQKTLTGDIDYNRAQKHAGAITPVPGGVGPMTIAMLMHNTLIAACRRRNISSPKMPIF